MEQLHFITKLLDIKDPNIQILDIINKDTHKEIIAKLDYDAPSCPECGNQLKKYDFQKPSKIPYLETTGMPSRILLRKRRFKCYHCSKMMVAETSIVKKNHQIPRIINQNRPEYQKRKDEICPFSSLADFNPLQLTKSRKIPCLVNKGFCEFSI
ncbi:transposase [Streptococcus pneumoniae]|nr:transposase [Streptococcus pneumoniae]